MAFFNHFFPELAFCRRSLGSHLSVGGMETAILIEKKNIFFLLKCLYRSLYKFRQNARDTCCQLKTFLKSYLACRFCWLYRTVFEPLLLKLVPYSATFYVNKTSESVHDMHTSRRVFIANHKLEICRANHKY